jgi:nucleoside-diphosphate-sugar epimerase
MRVFVAGATGAIGRPLVARLLAGGHEVWGMSRTQAGADAVGRLGAHGVVADALDAGAVQRVVGEAAPEVVVQQLTAWPQKMSPKTMAEGMRQTDRLRDQGTANLLAAAGGARLVAQSIPFFVKPGDGAVAAGDAPLLTDAPEPLGGVLRRLERMERSVVEAEGTVLRYANLYGPGTWYDRSGAVTKMLKRRSYPQMGNGRGRWGWLHVDDAATATVAAIERPVPGIYTVADDHPAPVHDWLPEFAAAVGAPKPLRVPAWLAARLAGDAAVFLATEAVGASNARFKATFDWEPAFPDWREGFRTL